MKNTKSQIKIGIIGLGDMGKMLAKIWANTYPVYASDLPEKTNALKEEFKDSSITILDDGVAVSRQCDFIMYCVETSQIEAVVKKYGPSTKFGAVVSGQTSVKTPELKAFEDYLPEDTIIIGSHALFGPNVNPAGQKMAYFNHRGKSDTAVKILKNIGAELVELDSGEAHDKMMADIQVVTHIGFESIGTSYMHRNVFPWENPQNPNGLDNLKLLLTLRIFSYKEHVYAGLALQNPYAKQDVRTYAQVENEIFGLMISEEKEKLFKLILDAKEKVFGSQKRELMFSTEFMSQHFLNETQEHKPNSHLSLLSMVVTWARLGTNPYQNLLCQTPPFKIRVGMAEYLFLNKSLLEESLITGLTDKSIRLDDLAFHTAVHEWANIIEKGDQNAYHSHFQETKEFLKDRLVEGKQKSNLIIAAL